MREQSREGLVVVAEYAQALRIDVMKERAS
jgi:hypothetical protein